MIQLNLVGACLCGQAAAKAMIEGGHRGSIVNVASMNAIGGAQNGAHEGAAKAGILGLTRSAAAEWAEHGIRVSAIAPGGRRRLPGDEDRLRATVLRDNRPGSAEQARHPRRGSDLLGGGSPEYIENVAAAAVCLASDLSAWVTGHTLVVDDDGTSAHAPPPAALYVRARDHPDARVASYPHCSYTNSQCTGRPAFSGEGANGCVESFRNSSAGRARFCYPPPPSCCSAPCPRSTRT